MSHIVLGPSELLWHAVSFSRYATGMVIDASTEKFAVKFNAARASAITDVDLSVHVVGSPGTFRIGIFTDSSDAPNTQLGGWVNFAAPAAGDAWIGLSTLGSNTGTLTIGSYYWIVVEYVSGTISATDYIQLRYYDAISPLYHRMRHHNGTNWTTTAAVVLASMFVCKHADLSYSGSFPWTAAVANSSAPDIFVNAGTSQQQGIKLRVGSKVLIAGVSFNIVKNNSPNDLVITIYEGDTSKYSVTVSGAAITTSQPTLVWFPSPVLLSADTDIYIILSQTGTSDANDYDSRVYGINSTYIDVLLSANMRFVYGSGNPSTFTVSTTEYPLLFPVIDDIESDFDCAAGGRPELRGGNL